MSLSVSVDIRRPVFVFPPPGGADAHLPGEVVITRHAAPKAKSKEDKAVAIGGVKVVWEVAVERRGRSYTAWADREVLGTWQVMACEDMSLGPGTTRLPFSLRLPADVAPTRETEFDRVTHSITATVLDPVPSYSTSHTHASLPPTPCSSPYGSPGSSRGASMVDLSSPDRPSGNNGKGLLRSMMRRHTADQVRLRDVVRKLSAPRMERTPAQSGYDAATTPRVLGECKVEVEVVSDRSAPGYSRDTESGGEVRNLLWHHRNEVEGLGRIDVCSSSDLFILGSTLDMEFIMTDLLPTATLHSATLSLVQHTTAPMLPPTRPAASASSYFPDVTATPPLGPASDFDAASPPPSLPPTPGPSYPLSTPSLPSTPTPLPSLPLPHTTDLPPTPAYSLAPPTPLPPAHLAPYSLASEGVSWSAFDLPPFPEGSDEAVMDSYRIFEVGVPHHPYSDRAPVKGEYVWRGETVLENDKAIRRGNHKSPAVKADKLLKNVVVGPSTVRIHKRLALPVPVIGALPSYRGDARLSSVSHKLHVAVFYSVLGKDEAGADLPRRTGAKADGTMRVYFAEKDVTLGPCSGLPDNIVAPPYTASPSSSPSHSHSHSPATRTDGRRTTSKSRPEKSPKKKSAEDEEDETRGVVRSRAYGVKGRERMHDVATAQKVLKERIKRHERETGGACSCFSPIKGLDSPGKA